MNFNSDILPISSLIQKSRSTVVLTGAGISTESGISDYRSKGGLWDRYQPVTLQEFLSDEEKRLEYWKRKLELYQNFLTVKPNSGHFAIANLEKIKKLDFLITQNIDGLHQLAGNSVEKIIEIHGTNRESVCLSCDRIISWEETFERLERGEKAPQCRECGGLLKPNTISFGQNLDPKKLELSFKYASECDVFIAIGSTLLVEPAASLPRIAKRNGARLIIITNSQTPLDHVCDLKVEHSASEVLTAIVEELRKE